MGLDGAVPTSLALGEDGFLYGATEQGGEHNAGTIFRATLDGDVATLFVFDGSAGMYPASLVVGDDGIVLERPTPEAWAGEPSTGSISLET